jgi:RNA polymerase sigma-70 factor (ECF subfamily)
MDTFFKNPEPLTTLYPEDEGELIRLSQREPGAFLLLFRHYLTPVYRYLYQRAGNTPAAEDLTARTFTHARRHLPELKPEPGAFGPWVLATARKQAESSLRGQAERPPLPVSLQDGDDDLPLLASLVERLAEGERELIRLRYAAGLGEVAIGRLFRRPTARVEGALAGLLDRTAEGLREHNLEPPLEAHAWLEKRLNRLFGLAEPDPGFAGRLEASLSAPPELDDRAQRKLRMRERLGSVRRRAWTVAVGLLVLITVPVLVIGPQPILAAAQDALVELSILDFVNLDGTRILDEPVSLERGQTTVTVTRAIAHTEGTLVVFESSGLPELAGGAASDPPSRIRLQLADGARLRPTTMELRPGAGRIEFPALPMDVDEFTLTIDRLPMIAPHMRPEDWSIPIQLRKANAANPDERLPEVFTPEQATDSRLGVMVEVLQVSEGPDETAVRLKVQPEDENWRLNYSPLALVLRDKQGRTYRPMMDPESGMMLIVDTHVPLIGPFGLAINEEEEKDGSRVLRYPPLAVPSDNLSLVLEMVSANMPANTSFVFDPQRVPMPGQVWDVNIPLDIAGLPAAVTQVEYSTGSRSTNGQIRITHRYRFTIQTQGGSERWVQVMSFTVGASPRIRTSEVTNTNGQIVLDVFTGDLPEVPITIHLKEATLVLTGNWSVGWPTRVQPSLEPLTTYHLNNVATTSGGFTVAVTELSLGRRATLVRLNLPDLPEGLGVAHVFGGMSGLGQLALEDQDGRRYRSLWADNWGEDSSTRNADPLLLAFPPLPASVERLTLTLPAFQLRSDTPTTLEVNLPEAVEILDEAAISVTGENVVARGEPQGWWPVESALEIGSYRLPFWRAALQRDLENPGHTWLVLRGWLEGERPPFDAAQLRVEALEGPDGQRWSAGESLFYVEGDNELNLWVSLDTSAVGSFAPGVYRLDIGEVNTFLRGPWQVEWEMGK